jgi:Uma2 family endonuclease
MPILIQDPMLEPAVRAVYENGCDPRPTEVWEGMTVVPPLANNDHFRLVFDLASAFAGAINRSRGDQVLPAGNVSDRDEGWEHNYRNPDVFVVMAGGLAVDHDTHWTGGPDLVVEIISPGEEPQLKFDFYARIGTREVLIVDRYPWAIELHQLQSGRLVLAGRSDLTKQAPIPSAVLPLTFRLEPAAPRPRIVVAHTATGQTWKA